MHALRDAQGYRLRAVECRQKPGTARDPKDKTNWQELERVWLELAVRTGPMRSWGSSQPHQNSARFTCRYSLQPIFFPLGALGRLEQSVRFWHICDLRSLSQLFR